MSGVNGWCDWNGWCVRVASYGRDTTGTLLMGCGAHSGK